MNLASIPCVLHGRQSQLPLFGPDSARILNPLLGPNVTLSSLLNPRSSLRARRPRFKPIQNSARAEDTLG